MYIFDRRIEGLMSTTFAIIDIFANNFPIIKIENLFFQDLIGLLESIEDESAGSLVPIYHETEYTSIGVLMGEAFLI
jgi:hypothetical protein